jgi:nucleotide-binding universal stress UspA family protein/GNAT superfamily N-acetyltransferase
VTLEQAVELRGGRRALLRPIGADDRQLLARTFDRLSPESRYRRFFIPIERLRASDLDHFTDVDHHDHEAIVAIDAQTGEGLGVARYVRDREQPERAETAVAVVDDWQARGLGRALLERLADRAREEGIHRFTALVQADNESAMRLLSTVGHSTRSVKDGVAELDIELPPESGLGGDLAAALRAAAGSLLTVRGLSERLRRRARDLYEGRERPAPRLRGPIVVGTDGSQSAARAVACAGELARAIDVDLHVVMAFTPAGREWRRERLEAPADVAHRNTPRQEAEAILRSSADRLDVDARTHARAGDPAEVILEIAEELGAALVVVGNKGMQSTSRFLLGSVPNNVSHHAPCNVLVVRTAA